MGDMSKTILIVDDNEINRIILSDMLEDEFNILEASDGEEGLAILNEKRDEITLVLLDLVMPKMDGFGVLAEMGETHLIDDIPVIMISADTAPQSMRRAFDLGAVDYINRPFDQYILHRRIINTIMIYGQQKSLTAIIVEQIKEKERESSLMVAILSHIVEFRNGESGKHVQHINTLTELLMDRLLSKTDKYDDIIPYKHIIKMASSLHDIGKIGVDEAILNKPAKLTPEEYEIMKKHTILGAKTMEQLLAFKDEPLVKFSRDICRWHHERWDGNGYPDGLKGDEIPIYAQIVSLADVYDALTSTRCYKEPYSHEKSINMILNGECGVFNPILIECLLDLGEDLDKRIDEPELARDNSSETLYREILRRIKG